MLREWEWPNWRIEQDIPRLIWVFVQVGILQMTDQGVLLPGRVADNDAWDQAWVLLGRDGVTQLGEHAS